MTVCFLTVPDAFLWSELHLPCQGRSQCCFGTETAWRRPSHCSSCAALPNSLFDCAVCVPDNSLPATGGKGNG